MWDVATTPSRIVAARMLKNARRRAVARMHVIGISRRKVAA
jgi:hypothetical protein